MVLAHLAVRRKGERHSGKSRRCRSLCTGQASGKGRGRVKTPDLVFCPGFGGTEMKRFVEGQDRGQLILLPECLDDYIGE